MATERVLEGLSPYNNPIAAQEGRPFLYPPSSVMVIAPLQYLEIGPALKIWAGVHLTLLVALIGVAWSVVRRRGRGLDFIVLALMLTAYPMANDIFEGQINLLVCLLVAGAAWAITRDKPLLAGALVAAAAHVKLLPVVLLIHFAFGKQWRALASSCAFLVILPLTLLPVTVSNLGLSGGVRAIPALHVEYVEHLIRPAVEGQSVGGMHQNYVPNSSFPAIAERAFGDAQLNRREPLRGPLLFGLPPLARKLIGFGAPAMLFALAVFVGWRRSDSKLARAHAMMLALIAAMMANPLFWPHHRLALVLALPVAFAVAHQTRKGALLLVLAVAPLFVVESVPQMMMWVYPKRFAEAVLRVVLWIEERGASLWASVFFWIVALGIVWPRRRKGSTSVSATVRPTAAGLA